MSSFASPAEAILALEDAYRRRDLEGAVACKDFRTEASIMLKSNLESAGAVLDEEVVAMTAEVLELSFRASIQKEGFPNFVGVTSTFSNVDVIDENVVAVTEVCRFPDGGVSHQRLLAAKGADGWRVLNPLD